MVFLLPHHLDNLPVQVDKEGSPEATSNANDSKGWQLLQVKWEVESEPSFEESCDGFFITVPHCQDPKDEGTEGGRKEAPPVVPNSEEGGGDFNAE